MASGTNQTFDEQDWRDIKIVMMQNLPCRCTAEEIISAVEELGFGSHISYFRHGGRGCGYGFIGFNTPELTRKFRDVFEGYTLNSRKSSKQVRLKPAHEQHWLQANTLAHQQHSSLPNQHATDPYPGQENSSLIAAAHQEETSLLEEKLRAAALESEWTVQGPKIYFSPPPGLENKSKWLLDASGAWVWRLSL